MINFKTALRGCALASTLAAAPIAAQTQDFINVLTGGTSGGSYPLGAGLANIYGEKIDGVRAQVQSTKASIENLNLPQDGRGALGFALGDSVAMAWAGNADAGFPKKPDKLRGIAAIYLNCIQIVASADSGNTQFRDLTSTSLSVGAPAPGIELTARAIFGAMDMSYEDLGKIAYLPFAGSVELIKKRQLNGTLQSAGLGLASIRDLAPSVPINVVAIPADVAEKRGAPHAATTVPAGTYDGQTSDVPTVAVANFLATHEGVSDELAYQMTNQMCENLDTLVAAHQTAAQIDMAQALEGMPIPLYPGAERYCREMGILK